MELEAQECLYKQGDSGDSFWFLISGSLEVTVKQGQETKFSKSIDENTFFGQKKAYQESRSDQAQVTSDKVKVIRFQTSVYEKIIANTELS